jgi:two-component system, OmpR family, sensor histidine kinase KdpD
LTTLFDEGGAMAREDGHSPEHFLSLIQRQQRGVLKIYLGFAAGVGKTYEMLQEGHRLKGRGTDVVAAIVETHGRAETAALIEGLEQLPRRRIEYRTVVLEEMDLDALLARRPTVALIDELAHTNAPGSRFNKRYQDVEEVLRAGINVISTLNIQHLESLHDIVEQATGVKVKERVPDYVLGMADQLVNVDVSAEDLRERLKAGKVYPAERIETSLQHFFTVANLTRLRELAMEEIAHRLDRLRHGKHSGAGPGGGSERVMVALSSRSPNPAALLRKAARMADRLAAPWYAVYIQTPRENLERIDAATQRQINNTLELARQLGGILLTMKGNDVASAIAIVVQEYCITHIVMGRTLRPWYQRWFGRSLLERILRQVRGVDLVIVDTG